MELSTEHGISRLRVLVDKSYYTVHFDCIIWSCCLNFFRWLQIEVAFYCTSGSSLSFLCISKAQTMLALISKDMVYCVKVKLAMRQLCHWQSCPGRWVTLTSVLCTPVHSSWWSLHLSQCGYDPGHDAQQENLHQAPCCNSTWRKTRRYKNELDVFNNANIQSLEMRERVTLYNLVLVLCL